jgi:hypothetical protein
MPCEQFGAFSSVAGVLSIVITAANTTDANPMVERAKIFELIFI